MKLQKLRLAGFKSFVDPTEFLIEPGLTGVVGPNGCGKSNLLEALRWVMGATSAKALRAGGMDEVIFAGGGGRPARSHAEVTLTLDNADRTAPAAFNNDQTIQVGRRIDRGEGSTFRVNGREVRARDVQLLFADASTGANSPALVRQGQISELIAAKPENRRRVLEEAGGVGGLHARRHEAELRLKAAEANLERLDDVVGELEGALNRLRREARAAERYKRLSAEIRGLQSALLHARWSEAAAAAEAAAADLAAATASVEAATAEAASLTTEAADAASVLPPLRDEEMVAAAVLQRLTLERDRLQAEEDRARADAERLKGEIARLAADAEREERIAADASVQLERLADSLSRAEREVAAAPQRLPALKAARDSAEAARAEADAAVERLASAAAAAEADARAAQQRRSDLSAAVQRAVAALTAAKAERASIPDAPPPAAAEAEGALSRAEAALSTARAALETTEAERAAAVEAEAAARAAAREADDRLGRLRSEARGLAELLSAARPGAHAPALDSLAVAAGYEAALAAALGDDLQAALDPAASSWWALLHREAGEVAGRRPDGGGAGPPDSWAWPEGVEPLSAQVAAPPALASRLAAVGVCQRSDGARLQATLPPGARLVSQQGDLWRWDGLTARADAPRPAAIRLAQKTRLAELEAELETLAPAAAEAAERQRAAAAALQASTQVAADARRALPSTERDLSDAREAVALHAREADRRAARASALDATIERLTQELAEAEAALAGFPPLGGETDDRRSSEEGLTAARSTAAQAREAAAAARAQLDAETREAESRVRRVQSLARERDDWARRRSEARGRVEALERDRSLALAAQETAREAPAEAAARRSTLADEVARAEARRRAAADALSSADARRAEADRQLRAAEQTAASAREARAAADARLSSARERETEAAARLTETAGVSPEALGAQLAASALAHPKDPAGVEAHLRALELDRERIGGVNLLAEEEAASQAERLSTLQADRADLTQAIARLRQGVSSLNAEGRERLLAAFTIIDGHFRDLFTTLFGGGQAELRLVENDDPLEAGLEIFACPPGKRLSTMSLMSGGEQALTACALIFAVFLANPAPICVLDEVDAPLDDANVDRFCRLLDEMTRRTDTPFLVITHNGVTMSRMDRLYGVTMPERGVSQLVSVDLRGAEKLAAE